MDALSSKSRSRRSVPALGALHITPLSQEPLEDISYLDEEELPDGVQRSYLSSRSLPQTPSILSRSPSRSSSRHRNVSRSHRGAKSSLALTSLGAESVFSPTDPSAVRTRPKSALASGRQTPARVRIADAENTDFLLRTASMLVENARESKGQGWISKRNSSTSLDNYEARLLERDRDSTYPADDEMSAIWRRGDPSRSRGTSRNGMSLSSSRWGSRRGSRANLGFRTPGVSTPGSAYFEEMGLDMADEDELEQRDRDEQDVIDEWELRRLLGRRVGGFFEDVFGGWFDLRGEEGEHHEPNDLDEMPHTSAAQTSRERRQRFAGIKKDDIVTVEPAAEKGGTLADARWLLGLAHNILV